MEVATEQGKSATRRFDGILMAVIAFRVIS